jgi:anthranilate phosphoribosyltransferase
MVALTDTSVAPAMAGALLAALRTKGVIADEVRGFAKSMRKLARRPVLSAGSPLVDMVGTGGDGSGSFNLSSGAALLVAAMGIRVAKHGTSSVSSRSGSADVMRALGLQLPLDEIAAGECLDATSFTFFFAPHYHPAMKALMPIRQAMGVRTVFNILGPLSNPAEPPFHLIGAYNVEIAALMAETLSGLPIERAYVVHGEPGWDEATPIGPFTQFDVRPGKVTQSTRTAEEFSLPRCTAEELQGGDAAYNAEHLRAVLEGRQRGAHRNAIVLQAALVLELLGKASTPADAARMAEDAIESGAARKMLEKLTAFGQRTAEIPK